MYGISSLRERTCEAPNCSETFLIGGKVIDAKDAQGRRVELHFCGWGCYADYKRAQLEKQR